MAEVKFERGDSVHLLGTRYFPLPKDEFVVLSRMPHTQGLEIQYRVRS